MNYPFLRTVVAVVALLSSTGCISSSVKNHKVLSSSSQESLRAPVAVFVEMAKDGTFDIRGDYDVPEMLQKSLKKAFAKQRIGTAAEGGSSVSIEITGVRALSGATRAMWGGLPGGDYVKATIRWSDGSSIELTGATGMEYGAAFKYGTRVPIACDELANAIAKETKKRLTG